ncbi:MAG: hypothetical protein RLZZ216_1871 [Cyanobacteriota bacterium]
MSSKNVEVLLLAPDLLGESLALQLSMEADTCAVRLRPEQLNQHPGLVIWSVDEQIGFGALRRELLQLNERWQPAPVLLLLPAQLNLSEDELLQLDCPGLLQDPDLPSLREAITTLREGGRVLRLRQSAGPQPSASTPAATLGLGQWLLVSGLQQISHDLQVIESLLNPPPEHLLLRLLLEGRCRELRSARNLLLWLWGPLQVGLVDAVPLGQQSRTILEEGGDSHHQASTAITLRERNATAVWTAIQERLQGAVNAGLGNGTGSLLAMEGLNPERRRDLLLALLQQLDQVMARLRREEMEPEDLHAAALTDSWHALQPQLRKQALQSMTGSYVRLPQGDSLQPVTESLLTQADLQQADEELPDPRRMLDPLVLDQPVLVDGQLLPAHHPRALLQLETLVSNWLVRTAELISGELISACGDWPELRRYLLNQHLISTRELERLRNQLNHQNRWQLWIQRPIRLYESRRLLYRLRAGRIEPLILVEPRDSELKQLGWWQQQVALLLEARDAIAPQMQALVRTIGDLMVVLLTQVVGRAIGLIGRGIAQGMGRSLNQRPAGRG